MKKYDKLISAKLVKKAIKNHNTNHFDVDMLIWELEALINEN